MYQPGIWSGFHDTGEDILLHLECLCEVQLLVIVQTGENLQERSECPTPTLVCVRFSMKVLLPVPVTPITAMTTSFDLGMDSVLPKCGMA